MEGGAAAELLMYINNINIKTSFFDVVFEVKKDLQDISAGKGIF